MRHSPQNLEPYRDLDHNVYQQSFHYNSVTSLEKHNQPPNTVTPVKTRTVAPNSNNHIYNINNNNHCHQLQSVAARQRQVQESVMPETELALESNKWNNSNHSSSNSMLLFQGNQKENTPMPRTTHQDNFAHVTNRIGQMNPSTQQTQGISQPQFASSDLYKMEEEQYEEIDEDNSSDFEEEEEMMRQIYYNNNQTLQQKQLHQQQQHQQPHQQHHPVQIDATASLLTFAENITNELQKYLHKNREQEDACDIYEDKWATTKSGRELYYADLLRIAQGETETSLSSNRNNKKLSSSKLQRNSNNTMDSSLPVTSQEGNARIESRLSGKSNDTRGFREASIGLGPLEELFEHGLKNGCGGVPENMTSSIASSRIMSTSVGLDERAKGSRACIDYGMTPWIRNDHHDDRSYSTDVSGVISIPMHQRALPQSFWKEPSGCSMNLANDSTEHQDSYLYNSNGNFGGGGGGKGDNYMGIDQQQRGMYLVTQKLPDFTDLMESWHGGGDK